MAGIPVKLFANVGLRGAISLFGKYLLAALAVACWPGAALAKPVIYTCSLSVADRQSWVPTEIVLARDGATVTVFDPIIQHFMGAPVSATIAVDTPERLTVQWQVRRIKKVEPRSTPNFDYSAQIQLVDNTISIRATPAGYDNRFWAQGKCKRK